MSSERTVVMPRLGKATQPQRRVRVQPASTPLPVDEHIEGLVLAVEQHFEQYLERLEHQKQCHSLLKGARESGEFSAQELASLEASVERQVAASQPIMDELAEEVMAAQEAWHRKADAMANVQQLLDPPVYADWQRQHDALADRLDALIEQLKS